MENNTLNIPSPEPLMAKKSFPLPYMFVSDDAFPLKEYFQKPFGQVGLTTEKRIFNYRLSPARCIVENSFGILANRFRVFMAPIHLFPEKAEIIVLVCCSLHNFLCTKKNSKPIYTPPESLSREDSATHTITPGEWRTEQLPQGMIPIERDGSNRN